MKSLAAADVASALGLQDVTHQLRGARRTEHNLKTHSPERIFNTQQAVFGNIMLVSALLLGFIVTGTMLSIHLTGTETFGLPELITFLVWSGLAAAFAFLSLIISFLTSVWGVSHMASSGPLEAARAMTVGSVLRHIMAEVSLYMSMCFFLVSLDRYVLMVFSGPDICPSYRGSAADCAQHGHRLFQVAADACRGSCLSLGADRCTSNSDMRSCLCGEACNPIWTRHYNWSAARLRRVEGVSVSYFHWFAYWSPGTANKPRREMVVLEAASLMCNRGALTARKDLCLHERSRNCTHELLAWDKSEDCVDAVKQNVDKCGKVCVWSGGYPPREAMARTSRFAFVPLGVTLVLLTLGRSISFAVRVYRVCREDWELVCAGSAGESLPALDSGGAYDELPADPLDDI